MGNTSTDTAVDETGSARGTGEAVSLRPGPNHPISRRLFTTEAQHAAALLAQRRARMLLVAYWLSGPFPGVSELVVIVDDASRELALIAVYDAARCRWIAGGMSTCPEDYRTADGASLEDLLGQVAKTLTGLLGDGDPCRLQWQRIGAPGSGGWRVPLPAGAELAPVLHGEAPTPDDLPGSAPGRAPVADRQQTAPRPRDLAASATPQPDLMRALDEHLRTRRDRLESEAADVRRARMLDLAHRVRGPFPGATELVIAVDLSSTSLSLSAIQDDDAVRWTRDGRSDHAAGYRSDDVDALVRDAELVLGSLLGEQDPEKLWHLVDLDVFADRSTFVVALPGAAEREQADYGTPSALSAAAVAVGRAARALDPLRAVLKRHRQPTGSGARRDRTEAAAAVMRDMAAALDVFEESIRAGRAVPSVEVVVDRDPDSLTGVDVFVDGLPHAAEITVVDPGAGHLLADWREACRRHADGASPAAAERIRERFAAYEGGPFIRDRDD